MERIVSVEDSEVFRDVRFWCYNMECEEAYLERVLIRKNSVLCYRCESSNLMVSVYNCKAVASDNGKWKLRRVLE